MGRISIRTSTPDPVITPNTTFELSATGEPGLKEDSPGLREVTAEVLLREVLDTIRATAFDPKRRAEFFRAVTTLEAFVDAARGVTETQPKMSQPNNAEQVPAAARAVLTHRADIAAANPLAYKLINWANVEREAADLDDINAEFERVDLRLQNIEIRQAYKGQMVYSDLNTLWQVLGSTTDVHRGLGRSLEPFTELFEGPAEKADATKKVIKRVLREAQQPKPEGKPEVKPPVDAEAKPATPATEVVKR